MKLLLHMCCAPCSIYPLEQLQNKNFDVMGLYYNPNIHPYTEFNKRKETLFEFSSQKNLKIIFKEDYPLNEWLQNVTFRESERCYYCYYSRLKTTAITAKRGKFKYFSTSLLYSKFQKHELIKSIAQNLAKEYGLEFYYEDFRAGWKYGIEQSKKLNMYRQQYCGCIYSERDRYYNKRV